MALYFILPFIQSVIFYMFLTFVSISLVLNDRGSGVPEGTCSLVAWNLKEFYPQLLACDCWPALAKDSPWNKTGGPKRGHI